MKHVQALVVFALLLVLANGPAFAQTDPRIMAFMKRGWPQTDFSKRSIELNEILSGGPSKDGIPSIDKPSFKPLGEIKNIGEFEPVIGLEINGDARAYPLRVLMWHEIVNDVVGKKPVTVTYCPLCNAAVVFERTVKGVVLDFGTTGLLRNSDLVMYDRQTQSWWQQFTGTAIVGEQLGTELVTVPARLESFKNFKQRFPNGKVLVPNNPNLRDYGRNPYASYDTRSRPFLYNGSMPQGIGAMERVVVFGKGADKKAYALTLLAKKGELKTGDYTVTWRKGQTSALDTSTISKGRDIGNITVQKNRGGKLEDVVYDVTFAFVVHAFHPKIKIIKN